MKIADRNRLLWYQDVFYELKQVPHRPKDLHFELKFI